MSRRSRSHQPRPAGTGGTGGTGSIRLLRMAAAAVGLTALLGLQACGGSGSGSGSGAAASGTAKPGGGGAAESLAANSADGLLEYARCLRQNGIDAPDPKPGQKLGEYFKSIVGVSPNRQRFREVNDLCAGKLPGELQEWRNAVQDPDKQLRFARCMRDNGVDLPDPSGGRLDFGSVDRDSPKFRAAAEKCLPELTKGGEAP